MVSECTQSPSISQSFFVVPFINTIPYKFIQLINSYNKKLAFTVNNKLNFFIKLYKDPIDRLSHSNVIYKICCKECDSSYVGQTSRKLSTRIKEHKANINRPSEPLSVVSGHRLEGHEFDWDNILILDEEPSYKKRLISEMLHISQQCNGLNVQSDTDLLDKSYIPLIKKCQK